MKPQIFSFFSGAGFLDLGFEHAGFQTVFANEVHPEFIRTYNYAREKLGIAKPKYGCFNNSIDDFSPGGKLEKEFGKLFASASLAGPVGFIGGPPCPDFSIAGKQRGKDGDNGRLSGAYIDMVCRHKPDFFVFENVKGLWRTKKHREYYEGLKKQLAESGYLLTDKLINSIEYGVPQDRERIILFGIHKDTTALEEIREAQFIWSANAPFCKEDVFVKPFPVTDTFMENTDAPMPPEVYPELTLQYWFEKNRVASHPNAGHYFQPRAGLPKFQSVLEGDCSKKSYKRPHRWRYAPTASYGNNEVHLHPYLARRMSVAETLAIQSLPAEYEMPSDVSLSNMFKMIGNGVPYLAAKGIAATVKTFLEKHYAPDMQRSGTENKKSA